MASTKPRWRGVSVPAESSLSISTNPAMLVIGVRSSWLTVATNSVLAVRASELSRYAVATSARVCAAAMSASSRSPGVVR